MVWFNTLWRRFLRPPLTKGPGRFLDLSTKLWKVLSRKQKLVLQRTISSTQDLTGLPSPRSLHQILQAIIKRRQNVQLLSLNWSKGMLIYLSRTKQSSTTQLQSLESETKRRHYHGQWQDYPSFVIHVQKSREDEIQKEEKSLLLFSFGMQKMRFEQV